MIMHELVAALDAGRAVALATVVATSRSVPRRPATKMLVYPDGRISGTVGGGEMEARVIGEAQAALTDGRPRLLEYRLVDPAAGDPGVCGGDVEIYVEPYMPEPTLYVIGAGHVGQAVAHLASWLGFRVVVNDDRAEEAAAVTSADATVVVGTIVDAIAAEPITDRTHVVLVTRSTKVDLDVLPHLLASPAPYIGVMGSARRWATTQAALREAGATDADLARVHAPVGIEIAAETPEEIAVSIMAEVIRHRRI